MILANQCEGLVALAVVGIVAGLLLPVFQRLEFGIVSSLLWSVAAGVSAVVVLALPQWVLGWWVSRRRRRLGDKRVANP